MAKQVKNYNIARPSAGTTIGGTGQRTLKTPTITDRFLQKGGEVYVTAFGGLVRQSKISKPRGKKDLTRKRLRDD